MRRIAFVLVLALLAGFERKAFASSCAELVRSAETHETAREDDLAARRYTEAVTLDATCEKAWLGLAALRVRQGDGREAERVAAVAFEHLPSVRVILVALARARWLQGRREEAEHDLEAYLEHAPSDDARGVLRELSGWYSAEGKLPAQLAVWRRLLALATNETDKKEALTTVRALVVLVSHADPVTSPSRNDSALRRAAARAAY
jgi:tetratricopeptide (TPR) repeat protein